MNIAVIGIGKFGKLVTEQLSKEHDVIVIDTEPKIIEDIVNQYDVKGYTGNGASYITQIEAGLKGFDVVFATTETDETNILCCLVAKKLGVKKTVARLRSPGYSVQSQIMSEELGIDVSLNPDQDTANEILRILRFPSAIKVESFANGKVDLVEVKVEKDSTLNGLSLMDIRNKYQVKILVCAVIRNDEVIIPKGDFILQEDDYVYITASSKEITKAFRKLDLIKSKLKDCMIIGCSKIAYYLAKQLVDSGIKVKIIDKDREMCHTFADFLPEALILNADATSHKLLNEEGIEDVDSVVTLTGDDEVNIILSAYAKSVGCEKVITKVNNPSYDLILSSTGLDSIVSPKEIFAANAIKYVRGMNASRSSEFRTLYRLVGNKVEASEFYIPKKTKFTSIPLKELKIKNNYLLACIIRDNKVIIPSGKDTIEEKDSVIIVTTNNDLEDVDDILG